MKTVELIEIEKLYMDCHVEMVKNKLAGLKTFDDHLQERYGDENSPERKEFESKIRR